jgi:hypothetical protein
MSAVGFQVSGKAFVCFIGLIGLIRSIGSDRGLRPVSFVQLV